MWIQSPSIVLQKWYIKYEIKKKKKIEKKKKGMQNLE